MRIACAAGKGQFSAASFFFVLRFKLQAQNQHNKGRSSFKKSAIFCVFSFRLFAVSKYANLSPSEKCSICRISGAKVFRISDSDIFSLYGWAFIGGLNGLS
jgi:hypothetical protein